MSSFQNHDMIIVTWVSNEHQIWAQYIFMQWIPFIKFVDVFTFIKCDVFIDLQVKLMLVVLIRALLR